MTAPTMKLLAVSDLSGHMVGGPVSAAVTLLAGLAERGHRVMLVGDRVYPGLETRVQHVAAPLPVGAAYAAQVREAIDRFSPDVVHVLAAGQRALAWLRPVLAGSPWLMTIHSVAPYERILRVLHGHERAHYALRDLRYAANVIGWKRLFGGGGVSRVIVHSAFVRDVVTRYGQPPEATTLIDLACGTRVDACEQALCVRRDGSDEGDKGDAGDRAGHEDGARGDDDRAPGSPTLVTVAGFAHTKGHHDALRALATLRPRHPRLRLRVAGELRDASYLAYLRALAARLGVADAVRLEIGLPQPAKLEWLRRADVYLQPSHEEGFCLAYLEAAQLSGRLVGTDTGAIRSIGEGDPWMHTVPARDPARMAQAIDQALRQRAPDAEAMRLRRDRLAARFSLERHVAAHESVYRELASRAQHAPHAQELRA